MRVELENKTGRTLAYQTGMSVGLDVEANVDVILEPMKVTVVPTGLWIKSYDLECSQLGEIQVRLRSSLAAKHNIILANGIGTIDLDYPNEIGVLLLNLGKEPFTIKKGTRVAQLVLAEAEYLSGNDITVQHGERLGGYGSTGN